MEVKEIEITVIEAIKMLTEQLKQLYSAVKILNKRLKGQYSHYPTKKEIKNIKIGLNKGYDYLNKEANIDDKAKVGQ